MPGELEASVFIATSLDGFIARLDGSLDWLPGADGETDMTYEGDYGYEDFMSSVDALLMGRSTYDAVLQFGGWSYGKTPVIVLTTRDLVTPDDPDAVVAPIAGDAATVVRRLAEQGYRHVYVDGGRTIQQFLAAGLVNRLVITRVPVLLGEGVPLFGTLPADVHLRHERTEAFASGFVQSTYSVI